MAGLLVPILTFFTVVCIGGGVILIRGARRRALEARLYGAPAGMAVGGSSRQGARLVGALEQVGRAVSSESAPPTDLRQKLAHAGYYDASAPTIYLGAQLLLVILAIPLAGLVALAAKLSLMTGLCTVVGVVAAAGVLPNVFVAIRRSQRRGEVRRQLPDAIDLLEICVSSGMGLDMAWNAVSDEFRGVSEVLADEMSLATLEMHLGAPRAQALRNMAQRTGVDDISSLVSTLVQSERFGTSVSQALRTYADAMRAARSSRAEEAAEKLAVKLLFPMVLFIFPVMLVAILGPAFIKISDMFAS